MKKLLFVSIVLSLFSFLNSTAQVKTVEEKYGNTLNAGVGVGYFNYIGVATMMGTVNYEFDVAPYFTLAPFIGVYGFQDNYYSFDTYRNYTYNETVVPMGVKASYYFDQLLHVTNKWDFYASLSAGYSYINVTWESGYTGDRAAYKSATNLYLNLHAGAKYHLSDMAGLFADLSTNAALVGVSIHFNKIK